MVIKIKFKSLNGISCRHLLVQSQQLRHGVKPCSKLTMETPKRRQIGLSDVSIVNSVANFEHVIIGRDISFKVSKQLTVPGYQCWSKLFN